MSCTKTKGTYFSEAQRAITIKISKTKHGIDNSSFCIEDVLPELKMRIHKHLNTDELIFIHRGKGVLMLDEQPVDVRTGDVIFVPTKPYHVEQINSNGNDDREKKKADS